MNVPNLGCDNETLAKAVPLWLDEEGAYGLSKYGLDNPQSSVFDGGLGEGGAALDDLRQYLTRFAYFFNSYHEEPCDDKLLLHSSQQLGKFVNASRFLLVAVLEPGLGKEESYTRSREVVYSYSTPGFLSQNKMTPSNPFLTVTYWERNCEKHVSQMTHMAESAPGAPAMQTEAKSVLKETIGLFAGFIAAYGVLAEPARTSGDIAEWERLRSGTMV